MKLFSMGVVSTVALLMSTGCSGGGDAAPTAQPTAQAPSAAAQDSATSDAESDEAETAKETTSDTPAEGPTSGGSGTLTMDSEVIEFATVLCYLQEQDSAGGGGKILYTAQATGVNAEGEDLMIDVSRYDEDSMFAGDSIEVVIGDYINDDSVSYSLMGGEEKNVSVKGSTVSASGLELTSDDMSDTVTASFEMNC
ncbi:MAG: hypothetical protein Q4P07_13310 [Ornithinimicrobium sp.]|uniref:hypothetical protein n=1 Tax=Ornithinimicrobium sp. TaxID=1977084 RepID=UPI0026E0BB70|nr:hypothetical protein [Ornithinimicrobium sp.]MDO5741115.1 hypothetical protein [Ornithinimicrobium sp.]